MDAGVRSRRRPRASHWWWPNLVGAAAIGSIVVVLAFWLHGGGLQDLVGDAPAMSAGRLTGLLAADLLLVQVFLMARIPWVEQSFGQDRLARWHHVTGFTSFWLMLFHVLLIVVGYAASTRTGLWAESWQLATTYPGMLLAVAGTGLLIAVVVLSVRAARRRMRYESWHLLHLYAYLGVGLALPHQLWTGADFVSSPPARAYWWALYIVCAGSVLLFRIALPVWRSARHRLRVSGVRAEAPGVFSVYVSGRKLHLMPVRSGQFFGWRFLGGTGWMRSHPYSLSASPRHGGFRVTIRAGGDDAERIARLRPGTPVLAEGPYGRFTDVVRTRPRLLLIGAGIGITPLRALLEDLPYRPGEAALVYRATHHADFALRAELDAVARHRGARIYYLDGPSPRRPSWLPGSLAHLSDVDALRWVAPDVAERDVYVCGPPQWSAVVRAALHDAGVPRWQVHHEDFAW
ncbi:MAG: ferric reductase-like transmembrane domain-containing protein [Actinocatenispora sp.]